MFLNSGVGSLWNHEHEFSTRTQLQPSNSIPRRSPLTRSAFSTPPPRKSTTYEDSPVVIPRPERPLSEQLPRIKEPVVRFQEVEQEAMSEDGRSVANSEGSETTTVGGGKQRRRSIRKSTTFQLAHPAPTLTQKQRLLQIRPKLLLQLQRLSPGSRPIPTLDILPSTIVVPRLMKKFPRMFRGHSALGFNDVLIVKSEEYDAGFETTVDESDSDEEGIARRDLVAVICQMRRDSGGSQGKAEIVLGDGSLWVASPMPNGLYEFTTTDERGDVTTARWVRRATKRKSVDVSDAANLHNDIKFTFSIIDPNSRRHPILATLTQKKLDIPDTFTSLSSSAGRHPPTSPIPHLPGELDGDEERSTERSTHVIDESMKSLIQVTSIWVALRQGWSPYFKYNDAMAVPNSHTLATGRVRSSSLTPESVRPPIARAGSNTPDSGNSAFGAALSSKIRRSSAKISPVNGALPRGDRFAPPKRSLSTGTAFVQRAAARRAGLPPSTVASDSEGESTQSNFPIHEKHNALNRASTPPCLTLPCSSTTTPDTPTRPHRRAQSAYIPTSSLQNGFTNSASEMNSSTIPPSNQYIDPIVKVKIGRWKQFTNLFRRKHNSSE
ncbi:uncharacterized protein LY89DRAFT_386607 [Mollisia scopiformis]|uniref:Uncharacterized protein n=1 Tax=Mollisia scopiformis TaxID=149040 RepID=A0A194XNY8_MOLSC|nr:uncharacterized protein LY89DRAFT_386607 [Mollisia scopiformis]KUJ21881.1 hypothetical protein LY89DRAFT_386607 [Mollisia scopiformis]